MTPLLEVRQLVKQYREIRAVDGVGFAVQSGSCLGLLGPNGAGKTTTVEILEGIIPATSGEVLFKGRPIDENFRQRAGIMFQHTSLQEFITVREALQLFERFYQRTSPLEALIESCALGEFLERDVRRLSGGQRQRLLLAIALINDPEILFLDEPTTGLDPQARRNFWQLIEKIKQNGKTVVLTTHYMDEAYQLCDEIVIMDRGRVIARGRPDDLLQSHFRNSVVSLPASQLPESLRQREDLTLHWRNSEVEIISQDLNASMRLLLDQGVPLDRMQVRSPTLEDLFLELTGHELRA
jgi:ABC-2 type transport system ATP-binding protein